MNPTGTISINGKNAMHANSWNEVNSKMAQDIAPLILGQDATRFADALELSKKGKANNPKRIDAANEAYMQLVCPILWKITQSNDPRFWNEVAKLEPEHYAMIIGAADNPTKWCLKVELIKQLFPKVKHKGTTYLGPRDYFRGMAFGEYISAQQRYSAWLKNRTKANLAKFFGILYRPERTDVHKESEQYYEDPRETYIPTKSDRYAARFSSYTESIMLVAVLYWQGCHSKLRTDYVHVFKGTSSKNSDPGEVVVSLAKSPGKDDVNQILHAPVHNIMRKLNKDAKQHK